MTDAIARCMEIVADATTETPLRPDDFFFEERRDGHGIMLVCPLHRTQTRPLTGMIGEPVGEDGRPTRSTEGFIRRIVGEQARLARRDAAIKAAGLDPETDTPFWSVCTDRAVTSIMRHHRVGTKELRIKADRPGPGGIELDFRSRDIGDPVPNTVGKIRISTDMLRVHRFQTSRSPVGYRIDPDLTLTYVDKAVITVASDRLPLTVEQALTGRPVRDALGHPALHGCAAQVVERFERTDEGYRITLEPVLVYLGRVPDGVDDGWRRPQAIN